MNQRNDSHHQRTPGQPNQELAGHMPDSMLDLTDIPEGRQMLAPPCLARVGRHLLEKR